MRSATALLASFTAGFLALATPAHAVLFDLAADWSNVNNGTGGNPWTYRGGTSALPSQADLGGYPYTQPGWSPSTSPGSFLPPWFLSVGNPGFASTDIVAGDVVTHSWDSGNGGSSGQANILFTAPFAGVATISGFAFNSRNIGRPERWDLYVNNVLQTGDTLPGDGTNVRSTPDTFNLASVALAAGDTVELWITTLGASGDFVTVSMSVDLTPAPEPASLALLAGGLAAMGLLRRR